MAANYFSALFSKRESIKAGKFLLGFGISFLILNGISILIPLEWIEFFFASITLVFLNLFGMAGEIVFVEPIIINFKQISMPITITYLCTGLLETVIILSAVVSSFGIKAKKRIYGVAAALMTVVTFNAARIAASILIIIYFGLDAAIFSHDILFRVFLFATIAGFYFYWFNWATRKKKQ